MKTREHRDAEKEWYQIFLTDSNSVGISDFILVTSKSGCSNIRMVITILHLTHFVKVSFSDAMKIHFFILIVSCGRREQE